MLNIIKLSLRWETCFYLRHHSSSRRYQFKLYEPIYYPKRVLSKDDELKTPLLVQSEKNSLSPLIDYYKILGVQKISSMQEIKAAYYSLAKKFHPDANRTPQETKSFQQISDAYDVLSDESKRTNYDRCSMARNIQQFSEAMALGDTSLNLQKTTLKSLRFFRGEKTNNPKVSLKDVYQNDIQKEIKIELKFLQAVHGTKEYIELSGTEECPQCHGTTRQTNPGNIEFCQKCGGTGQYRVSSDSNKISNVCDLCDGKRYVGKSKCKTCDNKGIVVQNQRVMVNVPAGSATGDILKITNPMNKQIVSVRLIVNKSSYFKRNGDNVFTDKYLTISQAVLGGKFKIRGLYADLEVNLGPGTESHTAHCFKGLGIKTKSASSAGDHIVTFKVRIPKILTTKQRQLMIALSRAEDPTFDGQQ